MKNIFVLFCFAGLCASGAEPTPEDVRLRNAADSLRDIMSAPDKGIPQDLLDKSQCVVVIPGMKKGAFVIGGKYGRGFVSCRHANGIGWSAPGAVRVEGGSFGLQFGGVETDVVMLVLNRRGMDKLLSSKFTIGLDAAGAAGPIGRSSAAQTDAFMNAELLTYSRSRGIFAGVSLDGATLRPDGDTNRALYGHDVSNRDVVLGNAAVPVAANSFVRELDRFSARH